MRRGDVHSTVSKSTMGTRLPRIRAVLICLVVVAVAPGGALLLSAASTLRDDLISAVTSDLTRAARLAAERMRARLELASGVLTAFASLPAVQRHDALACAATARKLLEHGTAYRNVAATTSDGTVFCSSIPGPPRFSVADRLYFRRAMQSRQAVAGEYVVGRATKVPVVHVARPVFDEDGTRRGITYAAIELAEAAEAIRDVTPGKGAVVTVFDENGTILLRSPDHESWVGTELDGNLLEQVIVRRHDAGEVDATGGGRLMYASAPVQMGGAETGIRVTVSVPRAEALAAANRVFSRTLAWYVFVAIASIVAAWVLGQFGFVRPMRRLAGAARRLQNGDLGARSGLERRRDEFGELGAAFDEMASAIHERRNLEQQVRRLQKMEALGRLASGVAHDFNNLLTVILSAARELQVELPESAPLRSEAEDIIAAGQRGAELTRQLLAFSRNEVLEPKIVDPNEVINGVRKLMARLLGREMALSFSLRSRANLRVDRGQLEQVLVNLAVNARDAMTHGGRLTIETADVELDGAPNGCRLGAHAGAYVMITVSDDGSGMDDQTLARLFEPFFTTKEVGKGTGLGLSTVWGIVKQAGGDIHVHSVKGEGSRFKVYLPGVDTCRARETAAA